MTDKYYAIDLSVYLYQQFVSLTLDYFKLKANLDT